MPRYFTSESVTKGHPDKVADQISDAVLDSALSQDRGSRVACETFVKDNIVIIGGEITTRARLLYEEIAADTIREIGYTDPDGGFTADNLKLIRIVGQQSPHIAQGVDRGTLLEQGAGDQGLMFGYASTVTPEKMPLPISLAHRLSRRLEEVRENGTLPYLRPDGKTQVTVQYGRDRNPERLHNVVVSTQHAKGIEHERIVGDVRTHVIETVCGEWLDDATEFHINPTGTFEIGGPVGDAGLTGRKIIVDTYGGWESHGGGAFSGKDPSKVDRSAAYMARYVAKHVVAAGLAQECGIQLAYAIGVAKPLSVHADMRGTGRIDEELLEEAIRRTFDLRPGAIVDQLRLRDVTYRPFASGGHMGREDLNAPWEETDRLEDLLRATKK
jgi:S-adenosylmethionine synthetase